jgi:Xaa-Pro aminopeptidase
MTQSNLFDADFFVGNRRALKARIQSDVPIIVTANGLLQRGADSSYAFSQDANFWYLTGVEEPDVTLVMHEDDEFLLVPGRAASRETFDGAVDIAELSRVSGITRIVDETAGWKHLDELLAKTLKVSMPVAADGYIEHYGMYTNPARSRTAARLKRHLPAVQIIDIRPELARLRMIKQPPELVALQQAIDITSKSLNDALAAGKEYEFEYQLEASIAHGFRYRGAHGHSFEPIVAGGKNACTLHNVKNRSPLHQQTLVVCDVGAEVSHYAADITRTISVGKPTTRQKAVYAAVLSVQEYALGLLKPGVSLKKYEQQVVKRMGEELKRLGLIKRADSKNIRQYFPHATSHFLGLNVHDVGDYQLPLEAGIVLTCEPGIYIPEEGIGVRLEDDVLITSEGNRVLSAACRKRLSSLH